MHGLVLGDVELVVSKTSTPALNTLQRVSVGAGRPRFPDLRGSSGSQRRSRNNTVEVRSAMLIGREASLESLQRCDTETRLHNIRLQAVKFCKIFIKP